MKKIEFDELQQSRRNQYGYQSFILLAMLIMIDSVLYGMGFIWMKHPTNTFIILLVGFTYFISRCIWGDALVGPKESPKRMTAKTIGIAIFAVAIAILTMGYLVSYRNMAPSTDNDGSAMTVVCGIMWAVIGVVYLIKRVRGNKTEQ